MRLPLILRTDAYKNSHPWMYPPNTVNMHSYFESRGGLYNEYVMFGMSYLIGEYLSRRISMGDIEKSRDFVTRMGLPFPYDGWYRIAHDLDGRLPIHIRAVPEGTIVPAGNVMFTVESTDPKTWWVAGWVETMMVRLWYPITVATRSWNIRQQLYSYLEKTSDNPDDHIDFMLHDFGARGVSSAESAALGGAAHLLSFNGTDTQEGAFLLNTHYGGMGYSIPAAEHAVITAWGKDSEVEAYRNILKAFAAKGKTVAVVSDSYDIYNAVEKLWGEDLRQHVIDSGAVVVIRPDSGYPPDVVELISHTLSSAFGHTVTDKGFKVLRHVKIIQGDGITEDTLETILDRVTRAGFSTENYAFGMGGGLLQDLTRDTGDFAYKCSSVGIANDMGQLIEQRPVYKDPVDGTKTSKRGRQDLVRLYDGTLTTKALEWRNTPYENTALQTVFYNGTAENGWDSVDVMRRRMHSYKRSETVNA